MAACGAERVDRARPRNRQQPRYGLSSRRVVSRRLLPHLPENIHQNILRIFADLHNSKNEAERDAVVTIVEGFERFGIPGSHTPDQLCVLAVRPFVEGHVFANTSRDQLVLDGPGSSTKCSSSQCNYARSPGLGWRRIKLLRCREPRPRICLREQSKTS